MYLAHTVLYYSTCFINYLNITLTYDTLTLCFYNHKDRIKYILAISKFYTILRLISDICNLHSAVLHNILHQLLKYEDLAPR